MPTNPYAAGGIRRANTETDTTCKTCLAIWKEVIQATPVAVLCVSDRWGLVIPVLFAKLRRSAGDSAQSRLSLSAIQEV
jgi:hypothetical protein